MRVAYLCKQVETAQFADNTVHLRQSLPFTAGLKDTYTVSHQTRSNTQDISTKTFGLIIFRTMETKCMDLSLHARLWQGC